jgi:hypothetical protein
LVVAQDPQPGTLVDIGTHQVVLTVTDGAGNSGSCTMTVNVVDMSPPSVTCPNAVTMSADANCQAAVPDVRANIVASHACTPLNGAVVSQDPAPGTFVGVGAHNVVVTVTDVGGNSGTCTVTVNVADTTPPSVTCPDAVTLSADANCQAAVPDFRSNVVTSDGCTPAAALAIAQDPAPGTLVGIGLQNVVMTVTDAAGNSSSCTVAVNVVDTGVLSVTCPAAVTAAPNANGQALVPDFRSGVVVSHGCQAVTGVVVTQDPAPGTLVGGGGHIVTLTARDVSGNTSQCTTVFTVEAVDLTPPVIICPPSTTVDAGAKGIARVPNFLARAQFSDNATPRWQLVKVQSPAAGTSVGIGVHLVTITVTDASGNSAVCTTTFSVRDVTAPVIRDVSASPDSLPRNDGQMVPVTLQVTATDNCDPVPSCQIVSVTSSEPETGPGDNTSPDWQITGPLTVELRAENSAQSSRRVYTLTVRCTDTSGNSATKTVKVPVKANGKPSR